MLLSRPWNSSSQIVWSSPDSFSDVSLSIKFAHKQRREEEKDKIWQALRLSFFSFLGSLAPRYQSLAIRAGLCSRPKVQKKDAPEEETGLAQYALSLTVSVLISAMLDPNIISKSGRILVTAELAHEYGFKDFGG